MTDVYLLFTEEELEKAKEFYTKAFNFIFNNDFDYDVEFQQDLVNKYGRFSMEAKGARVNGGISYWDNRIMLFPGVGGGGI